MLTKLQSDLIGWGCLFGIPAIALLGAWGTLRRSEAICKKETEEIIKACLTPEVSDEEHTSESVAEAVPLPKKAPVPILDYSDYKPRKSPLDRKSYELKSDYCGPMYVPGRSWNENFKGDDCC